MTHFDLHIHDITKHNSNRNSDQVVARYNNVRYNALPPSPNSNSC
jgi:hypothetical protein